MNRLLIFCLSLVIFFSCSDPNEELTGKLTLEISANESSSGRAMTESNAASFIISIQHESGEFIYDFESFDFIKVNDQLISKSFKLDVGSYKITDFLVLDEEDSVIYLSPKEGAALASFVSQPLPLSFAISHGQTNSVVLEVLPSNAGEVEDFGYAEFSFTVIDPGDSTLDIGLVAYYDFHGSTLNKAGDDYHGEGMNLVGSDGKGDSAYYFNGTDSHVDLGNAVGDSLRSISLWFNSSAQVNGYNEDIIALIARNNDYHGANNAGEFSISFSGTSFHNEQNRGRLVFTLRDEAGNGSAVFSEDTVWNENQWYHVVAQVSQSNGMMIYIDGVLQDYEMNVEPDYNQPTTFLDRATTIGCWGDLFNRNFDGIIDEVRLYNRTLTNKEVYSLYHEFD